MKLLYGLIEGSVGVLYTLYKPLYIDRGEAVAVQDGTQRTRPTLTFVQYGPQYPSLYLLRYGGGGTAVAAAFSTFTVVQTNVVQDGKNNALHCRTECPGIQF